MAMQRLSTKQLSKIGIFIAIAIFCGETMFLQFLVFTFPLKRTACDLLLFTLSVHPWNPFHSQTSTSKLASSGTAYRGRLWSSERTLSVSNLGETKFARCDIHTVSDIMLFNFLADVSPNAILLF